jgi:hypothetical protein
MPARLPCRLLAGVRWPMTTAGKGRSRSGWSRGVWWRSIEPAMEYTSRNGDRKEELKIHDVSRSVGLRIGGGLKFFLVSIAHPCNSESLLTRIFAIIYISRLLFFLSSPLSYLLPPPDLPVSRSRFHRRRPTAPPPRRRGRARVRRGQLRHPRKPGTLTPEP